MDIRPHEMTTQKHSCRAPMTASLAAEIVDLVAELANPKAFESLPDALHRLLIDIKRSALAGSTPVLATRGRGRVSGRAASPVPAKWRDSVPDLRGFPNLTTWRAICRHLDIAVNGDSARRKLRDWVSTHRPHWPAVPAPVAPVGTSAAPSTTPPAGPPSKALHGVSVASKRTSQSDPLRIDDLSAGAGTIGITFCPGKQDSRWHRDLDTDLAAIAEWRPTTILTLIQDHEMDRLNVMGLGDRIRERGIVWHHLPIKDVSTPDARFESRWSTLGAALAQSLRQGERVIVHCRGGLGRAGTVAALLLMELGFAATAAIVRVRTVRQGAIETPAQRQYVLNYPRTSTPQ